jgi:Domain of unknown function (DUF4402)
MKMHKTARIMVVITASLLPCAAHADVKVADATITVYEDIQFSVLLDMDFGTIVSDSTGGTVNIDPVNNSRTCPATMTCTGSFSFSELQLSGSDANVVVTYDPSFNLNGPGVPILVEPQFPGGSGAVVQLTGGSAIFKFGAQVHINPYQQPGAYNGVFTVDVSYQ